MDADAAFCDELITAVSQLKEGKVKEMLNSKRKVPKAARCLLHQVIRNLKMDDPKTETPKSLEIIRELIEHGANVEEKDENFKTALVLAIEGLLECRSSALFHLHERCIALLKDELASSGDGSTDFEYYDVDQHHNVMVAVLYHDKNALMEALQRDDATAPLTLTRLTPLHMACKLDKVEMVEVLLNAGANPLAEDAFGLTPLLLASAMGRSGPLSAMAKRLTQDAVNRKAKPRGTIDPPPRVNYLIKMQDAIEPGTTCLHEAVRANDSGCVRILLEKGADAGAEDSHGRVPIELAGTKADICSKQYLEILESLIRAEAKTSDHAFHIALLNALHVGNESALVALLRGGANPCLEEEPETALHVAASRGMEQPLKIFIKEMESRNEMNINVRDYKDRTALHRAAYEGHRECASLLIRSGADLSLTDESEVSCLEAVLLKLPKSVTFFLGEMDHLVSCKVRSLNEYSLRLNFGIFTNNECERQTALINTLLQSTLLSKKVKSDILVHPLVDTFCAIKWRRASFFFFSVVVLHFLYVVSLSTFTVLDYYKYSASSWASFFRYIHMIFATLVLFNATSLPDVNFTVKTLWRRKAEVTTLLFCASLSIVWAFATIFIDSEYLSWSLKNGWAKKVLLFLLPLSWLALMLMIGRYRAWGWRALLFGLVFKNTILTLGVLCLLLVGFSLSFFVAFKPFDEPLFGNPWLAIQTTFVMMTGEYNYSDISKMMGFYTHLLFILFVVVASLVINNLVVALAVYDANALSEIGDSRCLKKKLEFVYSLEIMSEILASRVRIEDSYVFLVKGSEEIGFRIHPKLVPGRILGFLMEKAFNNPTEEMEEQVYEEKSYSRRWDTVFSFIRQKNSLFSPV